MAPPAHEWTSRVRSVNNQIKVSAPFVGGQPIRIRVSTKIRADGSRPIDALGRWSNSDKPTTRRLTTTLSPDSWQAELAEAAEEAIELAKQEASGLPISIQTKKIIRLEPGVGRLGRQLEAAAEKIRRRAENKGITDKELGYHLRWLGIVQAHCEQVGCSLSMAAAAQALLAHYSEDRSRKSYKNAVTCMAWVLASIGEPNDIADHLVPLYSYKPGIRDIPTDAQVCDRLKAISDPDEQKLVYSIVVYGHRLLQIHGSRWAERRKDGRLPYYSYKNGKRCVGYPIPFGDESIDLNGWVPPRHDQLACYDQRPTGELKKLHTAESAVLSALVSRHLGCTATDMRHRWGSVAIQRNIFPNLALMARSMGTSVGMLERTYIQELDSLLLADEEL